MGREDSKEKNVKKSIKDYHLIYQGHRIVIGQNATNQWKANIKMYGQPEEDDDTHLGEFDISTDIQTIKKKIFEKLYPNIPDDTN